MRTTSNTRRSAAARFAAIRCRQLSERGEDATGDFGRPRALAITVGSDFGANVVCEFKHQHLIALANSQIRQHCSRSDSRTGLLVQFCTLGCNRARKIDVNGVMRMQNQCSPNIRSHITDTTARRHFKAH